MARNATGLRRRPEATRTTHLELLFDVVFVLALMQLAFVLADLSWSGIVRALILLFPLMEVWTVTAEQCNKFDPRLPQIRLLVLGNLLGTLLMAAAVPQAFGARGLYFAVANVAVQLGAAGVLLYLLRGDELQRVELRRAFWFSVAAVPWIVGALTEGWTRVVLWALAVAVTLASNVLGLPTPGLGRARAGEFAFSAAHLADRCRQFFTIALGELMLVTGLTLDHAGFEIAPLAAALAAFITTALLWRIYYNSAGELEADAIAAVAAPKAGRPVVFSHPVLVAGILAISVSYKLVIAHPLGHTPPAWIAFIVGGPALFLAGRAMLEYAVFRRVSGDRWLAILVLAGISPALILTPPLLAAFAATLALAAVATIDSVHSQRPPLRPAAASK